MLSLESLNEYASSMPLVSSFLLGVLVTLNPCTLAANVTALGFLGIEAKQSRDALRSGMLYTLGKTVAYFVLGMLLYFFAEHLELGDFIQDQYVKVVGFFFLIVGLLMLNVFHIHGAEHFVANLFRQRGDGACSVSQSLLFGVLMAFAFCPDGSIMYFGMMMPLTIKLDNLLVPLIFACGAALPMIAIVGVIGGGIDRLKAMQLRVNDYSSMLRKALGVLFVLTGVWFIAELLLHSYGE